MRVDPMFVFSSPRTREQRKSNLTYILRLLASLGIVRLVHPTSVDAKNPYWLPYNDNTGARITLAPSATRCDTSGLYAVTWSVEDWLDKTPGKEGTRKEGRNKKGIHLTLKLPLQIRIWFPILHIY